MKKLVLAFLILILIPVWTLAGFAASSDLKQQKSSVDKQLNSLGKKKQQEQKKLNSALDQKKTITNNQKQQDKQYQQISGEIKAINDEITGFNNAIKEAEDKYDNQKELFKVRLKVMYENADKSYVETLAESKSITDFFERLELITRISQKDRELMDQLLVSQKDVEYKKQNKEDEKQAKKQKASESLQALNQLKASRAEVDQEIKKISSNIDQLERQEDELLRESQQLESQIRSLQNSGKKYAGGSMVWPAPGWGQVTSYFGMRLHPILKKYRMHTGVDIHAPSGASIVAANKGTVISAGWQSGYGNTVIVDHGGGISTLYAHASKILVRTGDNVSAGQTIAKVGSTGLSTGPHLHFEVRKNGTPVDPLQYASP